ncbi:MAG TPA: biopolymer transporter ExbD [Oculatellaceae cyanobacterium]|jgi:biopolymer transport protein ExbD
MRAGGRKQVFNEINITPLTDIFLVLLIIMMVVAPMLDTQGLKVSVPSIGPSQETKEEPKTITLMIDAAGQYTIDGKTVESALLANEFRLLKGSKPDGVVIKTSPDASHEALTFAMDAAQAAGISKLAVTATEGGT